MNIEVTDRYKDRRMVNTENNKIDNNNNNKLVVFVTYKLTVMLLFRETLPLAKVIPIVNGLVHNVLADAPNPFLQV